MLRLLINQLTKNALTHHIVYVRVRIPVRGDVMKWRFLCYWPFIGESHRWAINVGFDIFFGVNQKTIEQTFDVSVIGTWHSGDVFVMICVSMYTCIYADRGACHFQIGINCIVLSCCIYYNCRRAIATAPLHENVFRIAGPLWWGIHRSAMVSPHKWLMMRRIDVFFDVNLNKRHIKHSRSRWIV